MKQETITEYYHDVVCRHNGSYYVLDKVFVYVKPDGRVGLHGATGSYYNVVTKDFYMAMYAEAFENDDPETNPLGEMWEMSGGSARISFAEYIEDVETFEGDEWLFNWASGKTKSLVVRHAVKHGHYRKSEIEGVETIGGGRIFSDTEFVYDEVYNQELLAHVQRVEEGKFPPTIREELKSYGAIYKKCEHCDNWEFYDEQTQDYFCPLCE